MNKSEARKRILTLRKDLDRHNRLYYVEARPEISDQAYDALYSELKQLEAQFSDLIAPDSPTQRVGGQPLRSSGMFITPYQCYPLKRWMHQRHRTNMRNQISIFELGDKTKTLLRSSRSSIRVSARF